jgi:hypothetical protein
MATNDEIEKIIKDGTKGRNIDLGDIVVACELARADERAKMAERMKLIVENEDNIEILCFNDGEMHFHNERCRDEYMDEWTELGKLIREKTKRLRL